MKFLKNDIINLSGIARLLGISYNGVNFKLNPEKKHHKFSSEQKAKIKEAIKDLYEESQKAE